MSASSDEVFDVVVIGNGMFGSAAGRHLAQAGRSVCVLGAPTVPDPTDPNRVYASHDDEARLTRLQDRDEAWAAVTRRSVDNYRAIEQASGISFYEPVGCLISARPGEGDDPLEVMDLTNVAYDYHPPGDGSWRERWPDLHFPESHYVVYEPAPAGYLRPKRLIEAQNALARMAGGEVRTATVVAAEPLVGRGYRVVTSTGESVIAGVVLVAAGAFANFHRLVPEPLPTRLKTEVIILGQVSPGDAERLATVPTVKFLNDDAGPTAGLEGIYMVGPVQYPDGHHHIKMGANIVLDSWPSDLPQVQAWFETATDADYLPLLQPALTSLWPNLRFEGFRTKTCIITYTDDHRPLIDEVNEGLFVAVAGNGGGAKGSDAWGEQAANLVLSAG